MVFIFICSLITNFGSIIAWAIVIELLFNFAGENGTEKVALLGLAALFVANVAVYFLKFLIAEPSKISHVCLKDKLNPRQNLRISIRINQAIYSLKFIRMF